MSSPTPSKLVQGLMSRAGVSGVTLRPIKRTDPRVADVMDSIALTTINFGYCTAQEFNHFVGEHAGLAEEVILQELRETGFGFVKTVTDDPQNPKEVIVDLRPMAAAMLLIYSDKDFARGNSVLHYLKVVFMNAAWKGGQAMWSHHTLLEDTYAAYGHLFTIMRVADVADLSQPNETLTIARARRHVHAINELVKKDDELTEVFKLTLQLMYNLNYTGKVDYAGSYRSAYGASNTRVAYRHFWRKANKIIDNLRGPQAPKFK